MALAGPKVSFLKVEPLKKSLGTKTSLQTLIKLHGALLVGSA